MQELEVRRDWGSCYSHRRERLGKLFGGWEYAENPKGVFGRVQEGDKVVTDDLAEAFLSKLGIP